MNQQPVEKKVLSDGLRLDVHSIFYTIQGEGPLVGRPAVFVRLAGCNLNCQMCDTEYTQGRKPMTRWRLITAIGTLLPKPKGLVVITGGEPFRQNIVPLCNTLNRLGHTVQIETNGTLPVFSSLDDAVIIVCSPKTPKIHRSVQARCRDYKYVIEAGNVDEKDGLPITVLGLGTHAVARPGPEDVVYITPLDTGDEKENKRHTQQAIKSCMAHGYTLNVQLHKVIGVP